MQVGLTTKFLKIMLSYPPQSSVHMIALCPVWKDTPLHDRLSRADDLLLQDHGRYS
jgi:hypothetical protein